MQHRQVARVLGLAVLALALLAVSGDSALAQSAKITGTVVDMDEQPMAKITVYFETVKVEGAAGGIVRKVKTRKNGQFTIPFLAAGTYKIYPEVEGYTPIRMTAISTDSQKNVRYGDANNKPLTTLISREGDNIPAIPVAPQGGGAYVVGMCEVDIVMVKEEDYTQALAKLQQGAADAPTGTVDAKAIAKTRDPVERGDEFYAGGDYENAAAAYREAVELDADNPDAQYGLGKSLFKMDDMMGAQPALMAAGRLDPELPGPNFYLATIYHYLAQDAAAIAALEKERINSPDSEEVLENLASLYVDGGDQEKALGIIEEMLVLNPENTDARLLQANIYDKMGNKEQAETIYREILSQNPGQEDIIWYNIGVNAFNADKRPEAVTAFENSLKANPKSADSHWMLGLTLMGLGKSDEAVSHFQRYLKLEPKGQFAGDANEALARLNKG